jgi:hypothetical protein
MQTLTAQGQVILDICTVLKHRYRQPETWLLQTIPKPSLNQVEVVGAAVGVYLPGETLLLAPSTVPLERLGKGFKAFWGSEGQNAANSGKFRYPYVHMIGSVC